MKTNSKHTEKMLHKIRLRKREIKFRVWNGHNMEYKIMVGFLGTFYVSGIDEKDSASMSPFNTKYPEETPLMQFTGMRDLKNETEIYEGDIVKGGSYNGVMCYGKVVWYGNMFTTFPLPNLTEGHDANFVNMEVIGNVYANPELLI